MSDRMLRVEKYISTLTIGGDANLPLIFDLLIQDLHELREEIAVLRKHLASVQRLTQPLQRYGGPRND